MSTERPYHRFVFDDRGFAGNFEAMYQAGARDGWDPWDQDMVQGHPLVNLLDGTHTQGVLDLGCGKGGLTAAVAATVRATNAVGVDCSPTAVRIARARYPWLCFRVADLNNALLRWPAPLIVASEVLSYVHEWRQLVENMSRVASLMAIGLYLPPNPKGFVPSFAALEAALTAYGEIVERSGSDDHCYYLAACRPTDRRAT